MVANKILLQIPIHNHLPITMVKRRVGVKVTEDPLMILLVNQQVGLDFASGAETLQLLKKQIIL